ncbi:hypothetical protein Pmani_015446 [Petrolisthes manimaculis]|nr:hypothetical protein Pmani_015446 [Petrolisthes manimaculis]
MDKHELMHSFGPITDWIVSKFCDPQIFTSTLCYNILYLLFGPNPTRINKNYLPVILSHTPAGTSVDTLMHYSQLVQSGEFRQFDHGEKLN